MSGKEAAKDKTGNKDFAGCDENQGDDEVMKDNTVNEGFVLRHTYVPFPEGESLSSILKPNTYLKDDVVNYVSSMLREKFDAHISDTMFCNSLHDRGWWQGHKFFDFNVGDRKTNKPSVFTQKLILPIFIAQHWILWVRYDMTKSDTDCADWQLFCLDSLNSDNYYNRTMKWITDKTSLHWGKESMIESSRYHQKRGESLSEASTYRRKKGVPSYDHARIQVPQQTEVECGSRMIVHMLLALATNSSTEL